MSYKNVPGSETVGSVLKPVSDHLNPTHFDSHNIIEFLSKELRATNCASHHNMRHKLPDSQEVMVSILEQSLEAQTLLLYHGHFINDTLVDRLVMKPTFCRPRTE